MNEEEVAKRREELIEQRKKLLREEEAERLEHESPVVLSIFVGDLDGYKPEQIEKYLKNEIRMALERLELPDRAIIKTGVVIGRLVEEMKQ